jgi:hypothetical protein
MTDRPLCVCMLPERVRWRAFMLLGALAACSSSAGSHNGYRVVYHRASDSDEPRSRLANRNEAAEQSVPAQTDYPAATPESEDAEGARAAVGVAAGAAVVACALTKSCRSAIGADGAAAQTGADGGVAVLSQLEGCLVVSNDQQFLGVVTSNRFNTDSLLNEYGPHGSRFSQVSILNAFGPYGGEYSALSPFNQYTSTPPMLVCEGRGGVAYLTRNAALAPAVDPHLLLGFLRANN